MTDIESIDNYPKIRHLKYGGQASPKFGVEWNNDYWMIKLQKSLAEFKGKHASYQSSATSEYIGSHIYKSLDIPTHETKLVSYLGKLAIACKDFNTDKSLFNAAEIKNSLTPKEANLHSSSTPDHADYLSDVLKLTAYIAHEYDLPETLDRFWDMFVTDTFILNSDRNNHNWGVLDTTNQLGEIVRSHPILAPVYDNGSALYPNRNLEMFKTRNNSEDIKLDIFKTYRSYYIYDDKKHIHPFRFMKENNIPELSSAMERFLEKIDLEKINNILYDIPDIMPEEIKDFYSNLFSISLNDGFIPIWQGKKNIQLLNTITLPKTLKETPELEL